VIAALYPVVVLLGQLVLAVAGAGIGACAPWLLVPVLGRFAAGAVRLATGLGAGIGWALLRMVPAARPAAGVVPDA
jgi:hypothetical protein